VRSQKRREQRGARVLPRGAYRAFLARMKNAPNVLDTNPRASSEKPLSFRERDQSRGAKLIVALACRRAVVDAIDFFASASAQRFVDSESTRIFARSRYLAIVGGDPERRDNPIR